MIDERLAAEVNRLYWETDISVGEIANRLGLSRRALYDALRGRPTGSTCPACGAGLVYTNRSRRDAGQATCPDCGLEVDVPAAERPAQERGAAEGPAEERPAAEPAAPGQAVEGREAEDRTWAEPDATIEQEWDAGRLAPIAADASYMLDRALLLGGAALLGVAAGAILMLLARRR